jgi:hypothetical protein
MKSVVLHTVAGPYQAVRWQQEPKQLYSPSTPTVGYRTFLYIYEKIREIFRWLQLNFPETSV